ncbi:hypothetical protein DMP23_03980 [Amycolatopsis sp. A1MSW2902]|uniref:Uncharacterized protein n=1 Tax=Amycolatopsis rubida TaxID=112413 RepID=A0A1I5QKP3_9PSEU|nr:MULTISPECIES: hypothetical protein [Actinomycetes]ATY10961.1 hypothetical protein CU254_11130 [Amycolatopsis sp. AA4]EFL06505.1 predicted protein [Streptomyces sp. AA4]MYW96586.1 hypothetical protein [Amycolatopsis rubida]NEC61571.1 hypothetical protein [Amycolatopsis rubida]OAP26590.1 hypothetical protein A4R44_02577 [Amycolatopsis sp. M39]
MAENGALPPGWNPRFHEDLVGLDPYDPEARAFAAHLDRMERTGPTFTVEACLDQVADFAESSNRTGGLRYWVSALVVVLIVLGLLVTAWDIALHTVAFLSR